MVAEPGPYPPGFEPQQGIMTHIENFTPGTPIYDSQSQTAYSIMATLPGTPLIVTLEAEGAKLEELTKMVTFLRNLV